MTSELNPEVVEWQRQFQEPELAVRLQCAQINHEWQNELDLDAFVALDEDQTFGHIQLSNGYRVYLAPVWQLAEGYRSWFKVPQLSDLLSQWLWEKRAAETKYSDREEHLKAKGRVSMYRHRNWPVFSASLTLVRDTDAGEERLSDWDVTVSSWAHLFTDIEDRARVLFGAVVKPLPSHDFARKLKAEREQSADGYEF